MPDLDHPAMWRIVVAHLLFFKPGRGIGRVDDDVLVVIRVCRIIDPGIVVGDGTKRIIRTRRKGAVVGKDFAKGE